MRVLRSLRRRLTDKLRLVFHAACDDEDELLAKQVLEMLRGQVSAPPDLPTGQDRRTPEDLAGPAERLANLHHVRKPPGSNVYYL
jgi:hypothetical protein